MSVGYFVVAGSGGDSRSRGWNRQSGSRGFESPYLHHELAVVLYLIDFVYDWRILLF